MGARSDRKINTLGDFPPRQCGIATFSHDVPWDMSQQRPEWSTPVMSVTDSVVSVQGLDIMYAGPRGTKEPLKNRSPQK